MNKLLQHGVVSLTEVGVHAPGEGILSRFEIYLEGLLSQVMPEVKQVRKVEKWVPGREVILNKPRDQESPGVA